MIYFTQQGFNRSFDITNSVTDINTPICKLWNSNMIGNTIPSLPDDSIISNWVYVADCKITEDNTAVSVIDRRIIHLIAEVTTVNTISYDSLTLHYPDGSLAGFYIFDNIEMCYSNTVNKHHLWYYITTGTSYLRNLYITNISRPYSHIIEYNSFDDLPDINYSDKRIYRVTSLVDYDSNPNKFDTILVHAGQSVVNKLDYQLPIWYLSDCTLVGGEQLLDFTYSDYIYLNLPTRYTNMYDMFRMDLYLSILGNRVIKCKLDTSYLVTTDTYVTIRLSPITNSTVPASGKAQLYAPNTDILVTGVLNKLNDLLTIHINSDSHKDKLLNTLFKQFISDMIPPGYEYRVWSSNLDTVNTDFSNILGVNSYWRKLTGVITVSTNENDKYISHSGMMLGRKSNIGDLTRISDWYPLYTKETYERLNITDPIKYDGTYHYDNTKQYK